MVAGVVRREIVGRCRSGAALLRIYDGTFAQPSARRAFPSDDFRGCDDPDRHGHDQGMATFAFWLLDRFQRSVEPVGFIGEKGLTI